MRRFSAWLVLIPVILLLIAPVGAMRIPAIDFDVKVTPRAGVVQTITIQNFAFNPQTLVVNLNDTVRAINNDGVPHTVTSDQGLFDSGTIRPGKSKQAIAKRRGTYPYHCSIHPFMKGTVIVQ